jgi:hypothetical protein
MKIFALTIHHGILPHSREVAQREAADRQRLSLFDDRLDIQKADAERAGPEELKSSPPPLVPPQRPQVLQAYSKAPAIRTLRVFTSALTKPLLLGT